ncbi:translation initiation factor IF-2 [Helicobacter sp. MIT 01-3238]|uniref:translation initiation factor IF-2 n=1 Tax=Helicobacter sp. MIT 01-3238 TaxID=398627 RepID=UPI000E1E6ACA|nr:translation initiation factor IF-2 [Helicobacter sp. MIT 01-3238]RDU52738.1 translation initiation factor IF-2 [Helicobacter sp. MIT 01-3238]
MAIKVKLSEIAQDIARKPEEVVAKAKEMGLKVHNVTSSVDVEIAGYISEYVLTGVNKMPAPKSTKSTTKSTTKSKDSTKTSQAKKSDKEDSDKPKKATAKKTKDSKKEQESKDTTKTSPKKSTKSTTQKEAKTTKESKEVSKQDEADDSTQTQVLSQQATNDKPDIDKDSTLIQRSTGIRIVKKTPQADSTPKPAPQTPRQKAYAPSLHDMLDKEMKDEEPLIRKPKKPKKVAATHREGEQKLQITSREISSKDFDDEQDEIVLFDLNEREIRDEDKENEVRQIITDRVRVQRKNPWLNETRSISRSRRKKPPKQQVESNLSAKSAIVIPEEVRVYEFAEAAGRPLTEVIKVLFGLGLMATKNDFLDKDAIEILAEEFKMEVSIQSEEALSQDGESSFDESELSPRPPVVTIMGHVDHGKTSLLDAIRNSRIASAEAGGITQHIGAYMVEKNGKLISFIDTPGHEAFSQMRARGAQVTDIAIIVIAADDGVKQQTIEALNHAKAAGVEIIIAMNKMDKENANPDKLKSECAELGFMSQDWGGEYEFLPISAKSGEGLENLLESILLHAEILELKAAYNAPTQAIVLEGSIQKGRGPVASVIIKQGTLKVGDPVYAGTAYGRVRSMVNDRGESIDKLEPSSVASIAGLSEVPSAGSKLFVEQSDTAAREKAQKLAIYLRQKELSKSTKVSFEELSEMVAKGQLKTIPLIIKADTQGSLEAIKASVEKLNNDEVQVNVINFGVGGITQSDVELASASENSLILGFGLRPTGIVKTSAKELGVEIKTYSVIYDLLDDVKALISGLMSPLIEEENTGQAEVRETFSISKVGVIAGCMVTDGSIKRGIGVRLIRDGVVVHTGAIASLKRFKDDAKEVAKGYECGIMLENYNDIKVGDVFETFIQVKKAQKI